MADANTVTPALATLGGAGWTVQQPTPYIGGNGFVGYYTWATRPAANTVRPGSFIVVTDKGVAPGLFLTSDGTRWVPMGMQALARSAVAVTVTGSVAEVTLATVTVPGGLLGLNGSLLVVTTWSNTNNANNKTPRVRYDGQAALTPALTATATFSDIRRIRNRNSAAAQNVSTSNATPNSVGATTAAATALGVDSSVDKDLTLTGQLASAADSLTLESYEVWATP